MMIPLTAFSTMATPVACTILSLSPAPRYCEQSTVVPKLMTWNTNTAKFTIWLTTPTAATELSECWLSIIVSTTPNSITNAVSMNMGSTNLPSLPFILSFFISQIIILNVFRLQSYKKNNKCGINTQKYVCSHTTNLILVNRYAIFSTFRHKTID